MTTMRDAFFNKLYELAKEDRDVILVSADMGAPSLDKFRKDLSSQYINVGIAESNAITIAVGLALSGKNVFVYAIMPFVTTRVHEFLKLDVSLMNIPITIIGVGSGYSYEDSGPTHHTVEDISIMRILPNLEILCPSDNNMAKTMAVEATKTNHPTYIRLDRQPMEDKYYFPELSIQDGFRELKQEKDICIVATGNTVDQARQIKNVGVIDLYRLKPIPNEFIECLKKYKHIISWEEHLLAGGMGSILAELIVDNDLPIKLHRIGIDDEYVYEYGSRKEIQEAMGIDKNRVIKKIHSIII